MKSALVIGEALIDVVNDPDGHTTEHPGGSPANVAVGLARLGRTVRLATWFASDPLGAALRTHFKVNDVRVVPGSDRAHRTSSAIATLGTGSGATYEFDLQWHTPEVHLDSTVGIVHTGSIATTLQPGADAVLGIVRAARATSMVSYDPNLRPSIMGSPADVRQRVETLVSLADIVKVSDEDLHWLYPNVPADEIIRRWATTGPAVIVLTCGGAGAKAVTCTTTETEVAAPQVTVIDTVGAGDSFMSGLLDALWRAKLLGVDRRQQLREIDTETLTTTLQWATACAAITVSRAGANPPRRSDVITMIGNHNV